MAACPPVCMLVRSWSPPYFTEDMTVPTVYEVMEG